MGTKDTFLYTAHTFSYHFNLKIKLNKIHFCFARKDNYNWHRSLDKQCVYCTISGSLLIYGTDSWNVTKAHKLSPPSDPLKATRNSFPLFFPLFTQKQNPKLKKNYSTLPLYSSSPTIKINQSLI